MQWFAISLPAVNNDVEWNVIQDSFKRRQGLTNIVGSIDGTHIPIIPPPNYEWNSYVNCKGWNSIVFQCIALILRAEFNRAFALACTSLQWAHKMEAAAYR